MASTNKIKELFEKDFTELKLKKPGDFMDLVLDQIEKTKPLPMLSLGDNANQFKILMPNSTTGIFTGPTSTGSITVTEAQPTTFISDGTGDTADSPTYFKIEKFPLFEIGPIEFPEGSEEDNPFAVPGWAAFTDLKVTTDYLKLCSSFELIIHFKDILACRSDLPEDKKKLLLEIIEELKLMAKDIQTEQTEDEDILI